MHSAVSATRSLESPRVELYLDLSGMLPV